MGREASQVLRFGGFELDPVYGLLRKNGAEIKVAPQPFRALALLASHPGELVTREELRQTIWGDEAVVDFEHGLNTCIRQIRTALGEEADSAQIIETVPRLGYRLKVTPDRPSAAGRRLRWGLAAGLAVLAIAAVAARRAVKPAPRWAKPVRVAVLPFASTGSGRDDDTLAEGLAEDLIARLSAFQGARVISKNSALSFREKNFPLREIGARLNVGAVLAGTVRRSGDMVEVGARLVGLPEERELWSGHYVRPVAEVFAVQAEISAAVGKALRLGPETAPRKWPTENPEAYALYLRGRSAWERFNTGGTRTALELFERAAALDPGYAHAQAGVADAYVQLSYMPRPARKEGYPKATRAAERALALDGSLPEAHLAAAWVKMRFESDWGGAERECRRAIELDPNNPSARERYGFLLSLLGRFPEAIDQVRLAQSLDPLSPRTSWRAAYVLYYARRYDDCITQARRTLEIDSNYSWGYHALGQCYEGKGKLEEAIQAFARTGSASANLGHAYAVAGRTAEARKLLADREKETGGGAGLAMVYAALGEVDRAFECLERGYKKGDWLGNLKVAPGFDPLRPDPRFKQLLRKVGLAEAEPNGK